MPLIDFSLATPPTTPHDPAQLESAAKNLPHFVAQVRARIAALRPAANSAENQVQVEPGGKTFPTISAAIASITDASQKKEYVCYIGPGTYDERVVCKPWVFLQGSGPDQTYITAPAVKDFKSKGVVVGAANSAIQEVSVTSKGNGQGSVAVAVTCDNSSNFSIENCTIISADPVGGATTLAVAVDYGSGAHGSIVYLAYAQVSAYVAEAADQPLAVFAASVSFVQLTECKVIAQGGTQPWGGAAGFQSKLIVDNSYVEAAGYTLKLQGGQASCTANQCELVGPVYPGVVVNP